jgi:hypothetical protein
MRAEAGGRERSLGKVSVGEPGRSLWDATQHRGAHMIQCDKCDLCEIGPDGRKVFKCDPFSSIKEAECIAKWQLIRLDMLLGSYQSTLRWYSKLGPMQDKLFKYVQREINEMEETEGWKLEPEEGGEEDPDTPWPV